MRLLDKLALSFGWQFTKPRVRIDADGWIANDARCYPWPERDEDFIQVAYECGETSEIHKPSWWPKLWWRRRYPERRYNIIAFRFLPYPYPALKGTVRG